MNRPSLAIACLALAGARAFAAEPPPVRLALLIGQDVGGPEDERLRFAERDARRVYEVLTSLGDVAKDRAYLITDASADAVRQALRELRGRSAELERFGRTPILVVYVSSHADADGLRLASSRLSHAELRALVREVPAQLRLLVVDACASGALIRAKGGKRVAPFSIDLEGAPTVEGEVVLTSTGAGEPAQEWEALGGSLFTHHLLSALRGAADRDGDGRVTLFEAYSYTYERTLSESTSARAGPQHPSHEIELSGKGDLVLTQPAGRASGIILPAGRGGRYVISAAVSGELVAAADKDERRALRLALPPGRYVVRKPEGRFVRVGEVVVLPGTSARLEESAMEQVPYAEVARRGPRAIRPRALEVGYALSSPVIPGQGLAQRVSLGLRRERGPWDVGASVSAGLASIRGEALSIDQTELWGHLDLRWRVPIGWLLPYLGARGGAALVHQSFTRDQESMIQEVFDVSAMTARNGLAAEALATTGLEIPLATTLSARAEATFGVAAARLEAGWEGRPSVGARAALGWRW
jgi:hypothetical protein